MSIHYIWWVVGLVLIATELALPGFFLLWVGLAAVLMGFIVWVVPDMGALPQALLFFALSLATCLTYWRFLRGRGRDGAEAPSSLNRRGEQLIGRRLVLETAIQNGRGKARVGDSQWLAEGPDLPAGSSVEVVAVDGAVLRVRAAP
ncbi:NfeD family protein [Tahibacter amnicola]|uniref:NfeD family protein n=1 Tax=Tahibacter amnicola TaxID=2976241 RepID=A0ABY6BHM0_9GAMM|nr:NfeD family protein [Tahibacter amnicola]UXI69374.1 NfeD family protein [Tahibacter amnicola]